MCPPSIDTVSASLPEPPNAPGKGQAILNWWRNREPWQRWAMVIGLAIVLVLACERWQRWEQTSKPQTRQKTWERDGVIQLDENGDGFIDQEMRPGKVPGEFIVRKDANFDGTFDLRYRQLTNGLATGMEVIKEPAPRR